MPQYLLSIYQPDGVLPPGPVSQKISADVRAVRQRMQAEGVLVITAALQPAAAATVVRAKDGGLLTTDGPFTETKEHIGGFVLIEVPDVEAAVTWAGKVAEATTLPIEVRAVRGDR